jgi:hypothetical protein
MDRVCAINSADLKQDDSGCSFEGMNMRRNKFIVLAMMIFMCLLNVQGVFSWGSLTHVYITSRIVTGPAAVRVNAVYGSTAPDIPDAMTGSPFQGCLKGLTHTDYFKVWEMARSGPSHRLERAVALGFVAHNYEDYTAHASSQSLDPNTGYVIQKAAQLNNELMESGVWAQLGFDTDEDAPLRGWLSHGFIEFAGDYFVATQLDRTAGQLLFTAAASRCNDFPELLNKAYAENMLPFSNHFTARFNTRSSSRILSDGEFTFRKVMADYGMLLADSGRKIRLYGLADYIYRISKNRDVELGNADLVVDILNVSLSVIQDDFIEEIDKTIQFAGEKLEQNGVRLQ